MKKVCVSEAGKCAYCGDAMAPTTAINARTCERCKARPLAERKAMNPAYATYVKGAGARIVDKRGN